MYERLYWGYLMSTLLAAWQLRETLDDPGIGAELPVPAELATQLLDTSRISAQYDTLLDFYYNLLGRRWIFDYAVTDAMLVKLIASMNEVLGRGKGVPFVAKAIRDFFGIKRGQVGAKGLFAKSKAIARSHTIYTLNHAALERYKKSDVVDRVEWIATNDSRTCKICQGLDGTIWELGQEKVPVLDSHFSCRCSLVPLLLDAAPGLPKLALRDFIADAFGDDVPLQLQPRIWNAAA